MTHIDWTRTVALVHALGIPWLGLAIVLNTTILLCWAGLCCAVLPLGERVPYPRMVEINAVAWAIMNTVPFLAGHASAVVLLVRRGRMTQPGALAVLALDQLGEGLAKVAVFLAVAFLAPIPPRMRTGIAIATSTVGALFVALITTAHAHAWISGLSTNGDEASLPRRLRHFVGRWARALDALRSWRRGVTAGGCAVLMKTTELVAMVAVQHSFGLTLPIGASLLVLAATMLATMVPLAPANLGTYEASAFVAYRFAGVSAEQALGLAVIQHLCFLIPAVGTGYAILLLRPRGPAMEPAS